MNARQRWCSVFIVVVAFAIRVWALDFKPAHFDEGINGSFIDGMRTEGCYRYDPTNFHGPLHFYTLFAGQQMFGRSLTVLRMPTVLIGTATVLLLLEMWRFFGYRTAAWAAFAAAISPAMTFYSRYAIHEMWLPFFAVLACLGGLAIARGERRVRDLWRVGLGLAGMILTKETYILHFVAAFLAWAAMWLFGQASGRSTKPRPADLFSGKARVFDPVPEPEISETAFAPRDIARVVFSCAAIIVVFYTGFFMNWDGLAGLVETFKPMVTKGTHGEEGHNKEMLYWLKLLTHYEWPAVAGMVAALLLALPRSRVMGTLLLVAGIALTAFDHHAVAALPRLDKPFEFLLPKLGLRDEGAIGVHLALIGACMAFAMPSRDPRMRWCALYALGCLAAYSLIPYKTPWCIVNVLWPFFITLGYSLRAIGAITRPILVTSVSTLLMIPPALDTLRLNFNDRTQWPNPTLDAFVPKLGATEFDGDRYAYVQTNFDINNLLGPLDRLVKMDPRNRQLTGHIIGDSFPLIWLLNDFPNIKFHEPESTLESCDADFLIIPDARIYDIEPRLLGIYYRQPHTTRGVGRDSWLYLLAERFAPVMPPEHVPRIPQSDDLPQ